MSRPTSLFWIFVIAFGGVAGVGADGAPQASQFALSPPAWSLGLPQAPGNAPAASAMAPPVSFDGISNPDNPSPVFPPDMIGAIGPRHYVQATSPFIFQIFQRTGTPVIPPTRLSSLFAAGGFTGPCTDDGAALGVLYDRIADRWVLYLTTLNPSSAFAACLAVSTTSDPAESYYLYEFSLGSLMSFAPRLGLWPDAYYMAANQTDATVSFRGAGFFAFDRTRMLAGDPTAGLVSFFDPSRAGMLPADSDGPAPPPGTPNYFVSFTDYGSGGPDTLEVFEFHVDWANPENSTVSVAPTVLGVGPFDSEVCSDFAGACISQPGTLTRLQGHTARLMPRLQYRNLGTHESLVVTHTVDAIGDLSAGQAGVRFYELRRALPGGSFVVYQQGTFAPGTDHRWIGSAAMDRDGNLAIGYSASSPSVFPSIRYAARRASDPLGALSGETTLLAGGRSQTENDRWSPRSSLSVDPVDDCTFWYTNQYYPATSTFGGWRTRIASFRLSSCGPPTANAGPDQAVYEGTPVTLDASASTGPGLAFGWTQLAGSPVVLDDPASVTPTFNAPIIEGGVGGNQTLSFQLTVSNTDGPSTDTVDVTVKNLNHPPVADAGADQTVNESSPVTLSAAHSFDPDNDPIVSYQWVQTGGPAVTVAGGSTAHPSFTAPELAGGSGASETLTFEVTVADGGLMATDAVVVTIEQVNHRPTASAGADQTKFESSVVTLDGSASEDPDQDPITYLWTQVCGPEVALSNPTVGKPTFIAPAVGPAGASLCFRLVVSDGLLASIPGEPGDVTVTVHSLNGQPDCTLAQPSQAALWPPNHKMVPVGILGVTDPDNNAVGIAITAITQDESVNGTGSGDTGPDAVLQGATALLRSERSGTGNGRVYRVQFVADDGQGGVCSGAVPVGVRLSMTPGATPIDDGQLYDSMEP